MSNKPGFFRQLKDTQNYSTKFLIVLFSPNSGVTPNIARTLNQRTESIVQTAYQNRLINDNDKILGAVAGYKTYETMPEIIEMIKSSLEFHQDKVNEFSMRYQAISQATFKPKI